MSQQQNGQNVMVWGRLVWLSGKTPFIGEPKLDQMTKQPRIGKNGEPMVEHGFGLAVPIPTNDPNISPQQKAEIEKNFTGIWNAIHAEAYAFYPQIPPGSPIPANFAMKYKDGNGPDHNGKPFTLRAIGKDGVSAYKDHYVFTMTTSMPIKYYRQDGTNYTQINEGIKCGDYVQVQTNIKSHAAVGQGRPGLYINPNFVLFLGYGDEIVNAPSGDQIFGTAPAFMPPGASSTPMAHGGFGAAVASPQAPGMGAVAPQPAYAPPQGQQQAPAQPHWGVLPQVHQPAAPPAGQGFPAMGAAPAPYPSNPQVPQGYPQQGGTPSMPPMPGFPQR